MGKAGHAERGDPVQRGRAQRVAGREVGDVVEADIVDVEDRADQVGQADRLGRDEVLEHPLDREAERPQREQCGEVATAAGKGQQAEAREGEGNEPAAAERAGPDDEGLEGWQVHLYPAVDDLDDVRHQPFLRRRVHRGALEHHEPEERRQGEHGEQEGGRRAGDRATEAERRVILDHEAAHGVRQPSHGA